jgi:hypothetical protein
VEYYNRPYLAGAPYDRVAERFRDVFLNVTEVDALGRLSFRSGATDDHGFMPKFTHLLEELNSRGGLRTDLIAEARAPVLKYFDGGAPIGVKLFGSFDRPRRPFLVKYSRREFLEPMLRDGVLRICPATYYEDVHLLPSIKDTETHRYFYIPTFRERLRGESNLLYQGHDIKFGNDDVSLPVVVPDYFLFSLSDSIYYRLPTDFSADPALIILDPNRFYRRLSGAFASRWPGWLRTMGPVTYFDPYIDYDRCRDPEMVKHFAYSYQREVRVVFRSQRRPTAPLEPEFLNIGSMVDYAELLTL